MKIPDKNIEELLQGISFSEENSSLTFTDEQIESLNEQLLAHDMRELLNRGRIDFPNGDVMELKIYKRNKLSQMVTKTVNYIRSFFS
jgi:hypothetical protein